MLKRGRLQARAWIARRKGDAKCSAETGRAINTDMSGMLLHNAVGDRQAEAGAASDTLRSEERIIDLDDIVRVNAYAVIGDFNRQRIFFAVVGRQDDPAVTVSN